MSRLRHKTYEHLLLSPWIKGNVIIVLRENEEEKVFTYDSLLAFACHQETTQAPATWVKPQ